MQEGFVQNLDDPRLMHCQLLASDALHGHVAEMGPQAHEVLGEQYWAMYATEWSSSAESPPPSQDMVSAVNRKQALMTNCPRCNWS